MFLGDDLSREIRDGINNGFSIGMSGKDKVALADLANLKATMEPDNAQNILASAAREINSGMKGPLQRSALMKLGGGVAGLNPQYRKSAGLSPLEGYKDGGFLRGPVNPNTGDDMFAYEPATGKTVGFKRGEYVLDDDIVRYIGVKNLDNMVEDTREAMSKEKPKGAEGYAGGGYIKPEGDTMLQRLGSSPAAKSADWVGRVAQFAGGAVPTLAVDASAHVANASNKFLGGSGDYFPTDNFGRHLERTQPDRVGRTTLFQGGGAVPRPVTPTAPAAKPVTKTPQTPKQVGRSVARGGGGRGLRGAVAPVAPTALPPIQDVTTPEVAEPAWGGEGVGTVAYMMDDKGVQAARVGADGNNYNETVSPGERGKLDWSLDPAGANKVAMSYGGVEGLYGDPTLKDRALRFNTATKNAGIEPGNTPAERIAHGTMRANLQQDQTNAQKYADDMVLGREKLAEEKRQANLGNDLGWYTAKTGRLNATKPSGGGGGGGGDKIDPVTKILLEKTAKTAKTPGEALEGMRGVLGQLAGTHTPIESQTFTVNNKPHRLAGNVHKKDYPEYAALTQKLHAVGEKYKKSSWWGSKSSQKELNEARSKIFADMARLGVKPTALEEEL